MTTVDPNLPLGMPAPTPSRLDAGFWEAAARHCLAVQRCVECGRHRFPPTESCYACQSLDAVWDTLAGTGTVVSYVWLPHAGQPDAERRRYYNVALIELFGAVGGPVRMLSNVVDAREIGDLRIDQPVELECIEVGDATLPCFHRCIGGDR